MSFANQNDDSFISLLRTGLLEDEQGQEDVVEFLIQGNHDNFTVSPAKILNDYVKQAYNVQLLGLVREDNGKKTLSFQVVIEPQDDPIINNMKVRLADQLSEVAQKIGNRNYRFITVKNALLQPGNNTYAIQYQDGKYFKAVKGKIVSEGHDKIIDLV